MSATLLLQYPEYAIAGLIALVLALVGMRRQGEIHAPQWLAQPAVDCLSYAPKKYLEWLRRALLWADYRSSHAFADCATFKIYLTLLSILSIACAPLHTVLILVFFGFFSTDLYLIARIQRRQQEIRTALPRILDLMVLCVDAGLSLDATLKRVSSESTATSRALHDELNILQREIFWGIDRERAYEDLYNRTGVPELRTLGSALTQATKLGLSISKILRGQSEFNRQRQSQKMEEKAMKAPIYMVFPLWFCIMPSLLLLLLGPSLIRFYQNLGGH